MGIAGLENYNSAGLYYSMMNGTAERTEKSTYTAQFEAIYSQIQQADDIETEQRENASQLEKSSQREDISQSENISQPRSVSQAESVSQLEETSQPEEIATPLGIGFAIAGTMGYGMSAFLIEKPESDDTIVRVKIATGKGNEEVDVNLSKFNPAHATAVEMFAYCQYKDAMGEGVNSKWGSWHAMKSIALAEGNGDFGSLDAIMHEKINWNRALAKSQTSLMDPDTNEVILSAADLLKILEEEALERISKSTETLQNSL